MVMVGMNERIGRISTSSWGEVDYPRLEASRPREHGCYHTAPWAFAHKVMD